MDAVDILSIKNADDVKPSSLTSGFVLFGGFVYRIVKSNNADDKSCDGCGVDLDYCSSFASQCPAKFGFILKAENT